MILEGLYYEESKALFYFWRIAENRVVASTSIQRHFDVMCLMGTIHLMWKETHRRKQMCNHL